MDSIQPRRGWLPFRRVNQLKNGGFNHKFFTWWNDWGHGVILCRFVFVLPAVMTATLQFSMKLQWNISECQNWKYCISSKCSGCRVMRACADTVRPSAEGEEQQRDSRHWKYSKEVWDWGGEGWGFCSSPSSKGLGYSKNISRQLIRGRQAVAAEMFVVVRLFWLQQAEPWCIGGEGPGHVWALWSIGTVVPLKCSLAEAPKIFTSADLIAQRRQGAVRSYAKEKKKKRKKRLRTNDTGQCLSGVNWKVALKKPP